MEQKGLALAITQLKDDSISFVLSNADASLANAIRRVMIAHIPTMAIDKTLIRTNSLFMVDEVLSHRLALVPLTSSRASEFVHFDQCTCQTRTSIEDTPDDKFCPKCCVVFRLKVHNDSDDPIQVTSDDLVFVECSDATPEQKELHKSVKPVAGGAIVLCLLDKNQAVDLTAVARRGKGSDHAKWSPVSVCGYKMTPIVTLKQDKEKKLAPSLRNSFIKSCPAHVFSAAEDGGVQIQDSKKCIDCNQCVEKARELKLPKSFVTVGRNEKEFLFELETIYSLAPEEVLKYSLYALTDKLNALKTALKEVMVSQEI